MWGRLLGVVFAVPALYFAARGVVTRPLAGRLGLLFLMGGTQGAVGWWMVKSGLHVSPFVQVLMLGLNIAACPSCTAVRLSVILLE